MILDATVLSTISFVFKGISLIVALVPLLSLAVNLAEGKLLRCNTL
jgi:hypothetical protein